MVIKMDNICTAWEDLAGQCTRAIGALGFTEIGRLKNLDAIPTAAGGKLSIGLECLDRDLWELEPVIEQIRALGVHRARLQSGWQKTESVEGVYDFAWLDKEVDLLIGAGIEPFLSLSYGNQLYCENPEEYPNLRFGGVGHMPVEHAHERAAWVRYVDAAVRHFSDRVKYFEIWNEPDISSFCNIKSLTWVDAYMELVRLTAPVIRSAYPDAIVLSCTASDRSIQPLIDRGLGDYVDIHSYHSYNAWPELIGNSQANRLSYAKAKAPHLEFWRGEAGYPSYNDPRSRGALSNQQVSEIKQAKFVLRHLLCDLACDALACTSYFHAYDFRHFMGIVRYHYGLIRHENHSGKPSYYALQVLAHQVDGEVRTRSDCPLAPGPKNPPALANDRLLSIRTETFEKDGKLLFAYWIPTELKDEITAEKCSFLLPCTDQLPEHPVILDPLTRMIYPIESREDFAAPVTDYPMLIVDRTLLDGMADIEALPEIADKKETIKQAYEE